MRTRKRLQTTSGMANRRNARRKCRTWDLGGALEEESEAREGDEGGGHGVLEHGGESEQLCRAQPPLRPQRFARRRRGRGEVQTVRMLLLPSRHVLGLRPPLAHLLATPFFLAEGRGHGSWCD